DDPLLEDGITPIPERQREAQELLVVADPGQPVLSPAVGARAGMVVWEIVPRRAVVTVILAHRPPLPLAEVGPPLLPGNASVTAGGEPLVLNSDHGVLLDQAFDRLDSQRAWSPGRPAARTSPSPSHAPDNGAGAQPRPEI